MRDRDASYYFRRFETAYRAGVDAQAAQGRLMRSIADAIFEHGAIPPSAEQTFRNLREAWAKDDPEPAVLSSAKTALWAELEAKNGDSTTITDATDRMLRAILCLADLVEPDNATDTAGWAAELLSTEQWPRQATYF